MKKYVVTVPSDVVAFWFELLESGSLSPKWHDGAVIMSAGELFERYIQWGGTHRLTPARLSMFINQMCGLMNRYQDAKCGALRLSIPRLSYCRLAFNEWEHFSNPAAAAAQFYGHVTRWENAA